MSPLSLWAAPKYLIGCKLVFLSAISFKKKKKFFFFDPSFTNIIGQKVPEFGKNIQINLNVQLNVQ